jgi:hypothetical protein
LRDFGDNTGKPSQAPFARLISLSAINGFDQRDDWRLGIDIDHQLQFGQMLH